MGGVCVWVERCQQITNMHLHSLSTRGFEEKVIWLNLGVAIFKLTDLEVNHLIYVSTQDQKLNP